MRYVVFILMFWSAAAVAQSNFQKFYTSGQNAAAKGLYVKAVGELKNAEKAAKKKYEKNRVYQALADNYKAVSDYPHAIDYYTKLLDIYDEENRKKVLLNLSGLWILTGQYQKVVDNLRDMQNSPDETVRLNNLASAYIRLCKYDEASEFLDGVLQNSQSKTYKIALQNKGYLYWCQNKFKEADSLLQLSVKLFDIDDENRYVCLANLAKVLSEIGEYDKAEKTIDTVLEWQKAHLGEKHFDYIISLRKRAEILRKAGKTGDAMRSFKQYFFKERDYVSQNFAYMTENERLNFWHSQKPLVDECFELEDDADFLFDVAVFSKSVLTQANINFTNAVLKDENLKQLYETIIETKTAARNAACNERKTLENKVEILEKQFAEKFSDYKNFVSVLKTDGSHIRKALKSDAETVVEFVYYRKNGEMKYAALLLQKSKPVKFIPLFTQNEIENFELKDNLTVIKAIKYGTPEIVRKLYSDTLLSEKIWGGIVRQCPENSTVYFSPDGIFYNFGIENLCFKRTDLKLLRLSSSTVLCRKKKKYAAQNTALLIGGLDYNDTSYVKVHDNFTDRSGSVVAENIYGGLLWKYLVNTQTETDSVAGILKKHGNMVLTVSNGRGTEDFVKAFLPQARTALISTHGYSFGFKNIIDEYNMTDCFMQDSSMSLCGIVLSGANKTSKRTQTSAYIEDGYMTALEISGLDLSNMDLIMLSACQTGLGQVSLDGAAGLPRGLKKAGVNSMLVSLWEVNDLSTRLFSTYFFDYICSGQSKYGALKLAQKKVREFNGMVTLKVSEFSHSRMATITTEKTLRIKNLTNPYYWASFVLIDGID